MPSQSLGLKPQSSAQDPTGKDSSDLATGISQAYTRTQTLLASAESILKIYNDLNRDTEVYRDGISHKDMLEDDLVHLQLILEKKTRTVKHEIAKRSCGPNDRVESEKKIIMLQESADVEGLFP